MGLESGQAGAPVQGQSISRRRAVRGNGMVQYSLVKGADA